MKVKCKMKDATLQRGNITVAAKEVEIELDLTVKELFKSLLGAVGIASKKSIKK